MLKGTFGSVLVAMIKQGYNNIRIQAQIESFSDSDDETNQTKSLSFYSIAGSRMPSIAILENPE